MFWGTFFEDLEGMEQIQLRVLEGKHADLFRSYAPDVKAFREAKEVPNNVTVCVGKIRHSGTSSNQHEVELLKSLLPQHEWRDIKITLPAPCWYHLRYKSGHAFPKDVYASDEAYFDDVAKAYQEEFRLLHASGIRNVQIDDPTLATFCSKDMLNGWAADEDNDKTADEMFGLYIRCYNKCFERPPDMHLGIHLCRGNYIGSRHFFEGAYDRIAKRLFQVRIAGKSNQTKKRRIRRKSGIEPLYTPTSLTTSPQDLNVDTYYLEYDTSRTGGFEPLAHLPAHKNVVLGVVTSKFAPLEDADEMKARIYQAADCIAQGTGRSREQALQQCSVSPQCGFASHAEGNALGYEDMRKKLQLVRRIADEVWPGEA